MPHKRGGVAIAHVQLHRFNKRPASSIRQSVGSNQEYQSLLGSAITLRLLALIARSPIPDQSETKPAARQWLLRGVTDGPTDVTRDRNSSPRSRSEVQDYHGRVNHEH